ncbi:MAG TPA: 3D domain-containing protein [Spirochaetia bacterium]|nr:3D domain-containing protein [Spirochaetia bacterium]
MLKLNNRLFLILPVALFITLAAGFLFPSAAAAPAMPQRAKESQPITMEVLTTGYTAHDTGEDGKGITCTGTRARVGECAVDPGVIPLGSLLWVPGYSQRYGPVRAEDIGGAVQGKHIDLFFQNRKDAMAWGRRMEPLIILRRGDENAH